MNGSMISSHGRDGGSAHYVYRNYASPYRVLEDEALSVEAKRIILSSWASDLFAVESSPWLRQIPGIEKAVPLRDIFAALRMLDNDDAPPPGGAAQRPMAPLSYLSIPPKPLPGRQPRDGRGRPDRRWRQNGSQDFYSRAARM